MLSSFHFAHMEIMDRCNNTQTAYGLEKLYQEILEPIFIQNIPIEIWDDKITYPVVKTGYEYKELTLIKSKIHCSAVENHMP